MKRSPTWQPGGDLRAFQHTLVLDERPCGARQRAVERTGMRTAPSRSTPRGPSAYELVLVRWPKVSAVS